MHQSDSMLFVELEQDPRGPQFGRALTLLVIRLWEDTGRSNEEGEGGGHSWIHNLGLLRTGFILALELGVGTLQDTHEEIEVQRR